MSNEISAADKDQAIQILAEAIVFRSTGLGWRDTESQARTIAWSAGEAMFELVVKAQAVESAEDEGTYYAAVRELINFIGVKP